MSVTGSIMAGVGLAGSLGGAALESNASENAANTQANAAEKAANLQAELGQESLGFENYQYQQGMANEQPFLQGGAEGMSSLEYLLGLQNSATGAGGGGAGQSLSIPGVSGTVNVPGVKGLSASPNTNLGTFGSLMQSYPGGQFQAPTAAAAAASPGEQFALQQGENAIQSGAAANGSLLTGGTLNAEQQYGQGLASTNYNNVYNQTLQGYNTNYNVWSNNQANQFNRLAALSGMGQTAAQQLNSLGSTTASQVASTLGQTGQEVGQDFQNAGAATASGYVGSANALAGGLSGATGNLSQLLLLQQLMGSSGQNAPGMMQNGQNPMLGDLQGGTTPSNWGSNQFGLNNPWSV